MEGRSGQDLIGKYL